MINNEFYKDLGDKWYTNKGDAVALLRLEKAVTNPWVLRRMREFHSDFKGRVLDIGCGGGFLTFDLKREGWKCTGLDVSDEVLDVGRKRDPQQEIEWVVGRAEQLPFTEGTFDVVCMMDVLEHISEPKSALREATRVLAPGGTLIFHTFNRTLLSWLFAAKGLDWFIKDSQDHIHDWRMFIKPEDLTGWLEEFGWEVVRLQGLHPKILTRAFLQLLLTRRVPEDFEFRIGGGLQIGYLGCARKQHHHA